MNFPCRWQQAGAQHTLAEHLIDVIGGLEAFLDAHSLPLSCWPSKN